MPWQRNAPTAKATSEREKTADGRVATQPGMIRRPARPSTRTSWVGPAEVKAKLKAATEETKSLAVIKVERYTADAWMNSSKTMQKSK